MPSLHIYLILLAVIASSHCTTTTVYKCLEDKDIGDNICHVKETDADGNIINWVRKCPEGQRCNGYLDQADLVECKKDHVQKYYGDSCNINSDCLSNICSNSKCGAISDGGNCTESKECMNDAYCHEVNKTCIKFIKGGQTCDNTRRCTFGYFCALEKPDDTTKKCIQYLSIPPGQYAYNWKLCQTEKMENNICLGIELIGEQNANCSTYEDCMYYTVDANGTKKETYVSCATNLEGKPFCNTIYGGKGWEHYLNVYKKEVQNFKYEVPASEAIYGYEPFNLNLFTAKMHISPLYKELSKCVKEYYVQMILGIYGNGSAWLKVSGMLVMMVVSLML